MNPFPNAINFFLALWSLLPWSFQAFLVTSFLFFAVAVVIRILFKSS